MCNFDIYITCYESVVDLLQSDGHRSVVSIAEFSILVVKLLREY